MVVDHPHCLHVGIHDRAANKFEAALFEIFAQRVRFRSRHRDLLHRSPLILNRLNVVVKITKLFLYRQEKLRVGHRRAHF